MEYLSDTIIRRNLSERLDQTLNLGLSRLFANQPPKVIAMTKSIRDQAQDQGQVGLAS